MPWHVRWAMVFGAFTNSSLFLLRAAFPMLDAPVPEEGLLTGTFRIYLTISIIITSYGFGRGAIMVFLSTFKTPAV